MSEKNNTVEYFDENNGTEKLSKEDILMNESQILAGLLELGETKDKEENYHTVVIKRGGVPKLSFRVRPMSEEESVECRNQATKYAKTKKGQPKVAIETDWAKFRSLLIYNATINEDREKIWNNQKALDAFDLYEGYQMIDKVLLVGEKQRVLDIIDEISGADNEDETGEGAEETAKN